MQKHVYADKLKTLDIPESRHVLFTVSSRTVHHPRIATLSFFRTMFVYLFAYLFLFRHRYSSPNEELSIHRGPTIRDRDDIRRLVQRHDVSQA